MDDFFNLLTGFGTFTFFVGLIAVNSKGSSDHERRQNRELSILCAIFTVVCFTAVFYAPQINAYFFDKSQLSRPVKTAPIAQKLKKTLENRK